MPRVRRVTVYAASSRACERPLLDLAAEVGRGIAERGWTLVYGGTNLGAMAALADAALSKRCSRVEGVLVERFKDVAHAGLHDLRYAPDMRARKAALASLGDAFVVLPGGLGVLEELSEVLVERYLGVHDKPIVLVDLDDFWQPLIDLLTLQVHRKLASDTVLGLLTRARTANDALSAIDEYDASS